MRICLLGWGVNMLLGLSRRQSMVMVITIGLYLRALAFVGTNDVYNYRSLILGVLFITAAIVDLMTYRLPDIFTVGGALLALILPGGNIIDSIKGGLAGLSIITCIAIASRGGIGGGDIKLSLALGIFLGWPSILLALVLSFWSGGCIGLILILTKIKTRTDPIPFGPFLVMGTLATQLWGQELIRWYLTAVWGLY